MPLPISIQNLFSHVFFQFSILFVHVLQYSLLFVADFIINHTHSFNKFTSHFLCNFIPVFFYEFIWLFYDSHDEQFRVWTCVKINILSSVKWRNIFTSVASVFLRYIFALTKTADCFYTFRVRLRSSSFHFQLDLKEKMSHLTFELLMVSLTKCLCKFSYRFWKAA